MGSGGLGSIVELNARGVPVKVIWGSSKMNNDILVRADSPIKDLGQLKGKKVGVLGGAASFSANMFMAVTQAFYDFDPRKDDKVQYGASALLASLLQRGEIEAFLSNDPVTSIELSKGKVRSIGEMVQHLPARGHWARRAPGGDCARQACLRAGADRGGIGVARTGSCRAASRAFVPVYRGSGRMPARMPAWQPESPLHGTT